MKKFKVTIEETISDTEIIEAESIEEAKEKAIEMYNNGEFALKSGYTNNKMIMVKDSSTDEDGEWEEF